MRGGVDGERTVVAAWKLRHASTRTPFAGGDSPSPFGVLQPDLKGRCEVAAHATCERTSMENLEVCIRGEARAGSRR